MLYWAIVFLVVAGVAAILGFGGVVSVAAGIAKALFFVFIVLFLVFVVLAIVGARKLANKF